MTIYVWDTKGSKNEAKQVLSKIEDFQIIAINELAFSPSGTYLLSSGGDVDNSIAIHDWAGERMVANAKVDKEKVNGVAWIND